MGSPTVLAPDLSFQNLAEGSHPHPVYGTLAAD